MKKLIAILLVAVMMAAVLAGCAPKNSGAAITACIGEEPKTIDPTLNNAVDGATYLVHLFEGLTTVDKELSIKPGVAESWTISTDGLIYTFKLRDCKWSDGVAVKAGDFVYSWQRAVNPETAADYAYQLYYIKNAEDINAGKLPLSDLGVKAIDDKTLEVTLAAPCGYFEQIVGFPTLFPLREDVIKAHPDNWSSEAANYVGNGPYKLTSWAHDSAITMEKNTNYWNEKTILAKSIKFVLMADDNSILSAFKTGDILFGDSLPSEEIAAMTEDGTLSIKPQLGTYFYVVNTERKPYDDVRVRKALTLAIDRNFIINNVAKGNQIAANAFVPPGVPDEKAGSDFRANGKKYFDVSDAAYAANVAEAKKLLADAGFPDGKDFPTMEFITNDTSGHVAIAEAIQQMWKTNLGINMTISKQEWAVFQDTRSDGNFDVARHGWLGDYVDPMTFLDMWTSTSGQNDARWKVPAYDALIKEAKASSDRAIRMADMHKAEDMIIGDQMAVIPIYYYTDLFLTSKTLHDVVYSPLGFKYFMWSYVK